MDSTIVASIASGVIGLTAAVVTYSLTKGRERAAEWRKLRLDLYREYVMALAGIAEGRATPQAHARYADALNSLNLVAPRQVIAALYAYCDETAIRNTSRSQSKHDELFSALLRTIRSDVKPGLRRKTDQEAFRLFDVPAQQVSQR